MIKPSIDVAGQRPMERFSVGVDPGRTGAIAGFCPTSRQTLFIQPMLMIKNSGRVDTKRMVKALRKVLPLEFSATIERQGTRPGQGRVSAVQIGRMEGVVIGMLAALGCNDMVVVEPAYWKRVIGVTADKQSSISLARNRFRIDPETRLPDGEAEAALLALYDAARMTGHPAYKGLPT